MKTIEQLVAQMKSEILADILDLRVPVGVKSFCELHDYVDANCYGGFCDDDDEAWSALIAQFGGYVDECMPSGLVDFINEAQRSIDVWLSSGACYSEFWRYAENAESEDYEGVTRAFGDELKKRKELEVVASSMLRFIRQEGYVTQFQAAESMFRI